MKTTERINIDANQFASHESAPNEDIMFHDLHKGYTSGAIIEHDKVLDDAIKAVDGIVSRGGEVEALLDVYEILESLKIKQP